MKAYRKYDIVRTRVEQGGVRAGATLRVVASSETRVSCEEMEHLRSVDRLATTACYREIPWLDYRIEDVVPVSGVFPEWSLTFHDGSSRWPFDGEWVVSVGAVSWSFGPGYRRIPPTAAMVKVAASKACANAMADQAARDHREYDAAVFGRVDPFEHDRPDMETIVRMVNESCGPEAVKDVMAPKHLSAADVRRLADSKEKWGGERS